MVATVPGVRPPAGNYQDSPCPVLLTNYSFLKHILGDTGLDAVGRESSLMSIQGDTGILSPRSFNIAGSIYDFLKITFGATIKTQPYMEVPQV